MAALPTYPDETSRSFALFDRARRVLPGANSRHSVYFSPYPPYAVSGAGARIVDADGASRIDYVNNYTSLIHGHGHPDILRTAHAQIDRLTAVGLPTESEIALAELLVERLASVEQVRFANSGTEAVMLAIKAARAFTGRPKIAKVEGCYHGSYDFAEVSQTATPNRWGSPQAPTSVEVAAGEPQSVLDEVVVLPWNDVEASRALIRAHADELAAVLIDPLPSRIGMIPVSAAYATMVREETRRAGSLFILDEVFAFRVGYNGAQGLFGIDPDVTCLGKIIGGGFPVGAIAGKREVMSMFDMTVGKPKVYHGGTYNANPVTMTAGLKAMELMTPAAFSRLAKLGDRLRAGLRECLSVAGLPGHVMGTGSLGLVVLVSGELHSYRDFVGILPMLPTYGRIHQNLLNHGVFTSQTMLFALSTPMMDSDIDFTLEQVLQAMRAGAA